VNYVEGQAYLEGKQLTPQDVGSSDVDGGQVLSTAVGKAEMLLTPGIFLRLGDNSSLKMISPDLTETRVELQKGHASVEVDEIYPQNHIRVVEAGVVTDLLKSGYYEFNADDATEMVFKGKAAIEVADGKYTQAKGHREFTLREGPDGKPITLEKATSFDTQAAKDDLYNWSNLRSQYLAEANNEIAGTYDAAPDFYPGWYWDPSGWDYTFIGTSPYWSPFGFGFYPPWYGGFYGGGFYGRGFGHGRYGGGRFGGGIGRGRLNGGGLRGGGFHGGGGGFHGGGGGGHR
jgi:hypothetical protein